jgi:predicted enzyme related to lactoylglutathione lyase
MLIEAVPEVPIPASSQDRTLAFYAGTLGLQLVRADDSVLGVRWIQFTPGGGAPVLTLATWLDSMPPGCLRELVFRSGNVQADYHRLVAAGVEFDGPPCARPGHPAEAVFYDPAGNGFVLKAGRQSAGRPAGAGSKETASNVRSRQRPHSRSEPSARPATLRKQLHDLQADLAAAPADGGLLGHCLAFCPALAAHHQGEDAGMFADLLRTRSDLRPVPRNLAEDHQMIAGILTAVRDLAPEAAQATPERREVIRRELSGLAAIMESHYGYEERALSDALDRDVQDTGWGIRVSGLTSGGGRLPTLGAEPPQKAAVGRSHPLLDQASIVVESEDAHQVKYGTLSVRWVASVILV